MNATKTSTLRDLGQPAQIARYWIMEADQLRQFAGQDQVVRDNDAFFLLINAEMHELIQIMQLAAVRVNR
ncbi:MAG: hypothetical protein JSV36_00235 [Anaerolineae bacterium]|nr:MAG: hypothetical protein JSV36_00235 [Anaerolineae bacterium]